jgi:hypothetical protein
LTARATYLPATPKVFPYRVLEKSLIEVEPFKVLFQVRALEECKNEDE